MFISDSKSKKQPKRLDMGEKKDHPPFLSLKDFAERGIIINQNWSGLEALKAVACLASEKLEEEKKRKEKEETERKSVESNRYFWSSGLEASNDFEYGTSLRSCNDRPAWPARVSDRNGRDLSPEKPVRITIHDKYSKEGREFVVDFDKYGSSPGSTDKGAGLAGVSDRRERKIALKNPFTNSGSDMYSKKKQGFKVATRDKLLGDAMKAARIIPPEKEQDKECKGAVYTKQKQKLKRSVSNTDNSREKDSKSNKKVKKVQYIVPSVPADLPPNFREKIKNVNGSKINLVIQKPLYNTDLSSHHDRMSMPSNQILSIENFLNDDERNKLESKKDILVTFIEPKLQESKITLARWPKTENEKKKTFFYVLKRQWKKVVERNNLKSGDIIQVWSFRRPGDELCLALVLVDKGEQIDELNSQNNRADLDGANTSEGIDNGSSPTSEVTANGSNPTSEVNGSGSISPICEGMRPNATPASNPTP